MELFNKILKAAVDGGASDIHIKVGTPVIFRISRELISIDCPIPTEQWLNNVVDQMTPVHMKKKLEEDREVDFSYNVAGLGRFRTNVFQQRGSWALAMRHVKATVPSFEQLGLLEQIKSLAESPRGIVMVAGSTGSGKSTTLAAMIEHVNANFKKHIVTLEDPIEFVFEDNQSVIEQREIGLDTANFYGALKHVLRQDPRHHHARRNARRDHVHRRDECRRHGTSGFLHAAYDDGGAVHHAHLGFFQGGRPRQLAGCLRGVICQRMIPTVDGKMTPALEIMINSPLIKKMLEENRLDKLTAAIETGGDDGMLTFNQSLFNLVKAGSRHRKRSIGQGEQSAGAGDEFQRHLPQ